MTVKQLIKLLRPLEPNAIIDLSSDEEGNNYGDIADRLGEGKLKTTGEKVYSLYPISSEMAGDRYEN